MPKKYIKLGTIKKKTGIQLYEYLFNYGLLWDGTTDVFVLKKPAKKRVASQSIHAQDATKVRHSQKHMDDLYCANDSMDY